MTAPDPLRQRIAARHAQLTRWLNRGIGLTPAEVDEMAVLQEEIRNTPQTEHEARSQAFCDAILGVQR